jgi:hypothetical protein
VLEHVAYPKGGISYRFMRCSIVYVLNNVKVDVPLHVTLMLDSKGMD